MYRTAFACALLIATAAPLRAAEVVVVFEGLSSDHGEVHVDLFAEAHAGNFPYAERGALSAIHKPTRGVRAGGAGIALGELPPGRYALFAMHDANGNGDLDRNLIGLPTEDYGFSNGAAGRVRPPSFDDAAVVVPATGPTRIVIRLSH